MWSSERPPSVEEDVRVGTAHLLLRHRPAVLIIADIPLLGHARRFPVPHVRRVVPVPHDSHVVGYREEIVQRWDGPSAFERFP